MKKAVDIVLLPPENIMDLCIEINKKWVKGIDDEIELNKKSCIPHITLAMGVLDDSHFEDVKMIMSKIANKFSSLELKIVGVDVEERADGRKISGFQIEKSVELQKLHKQVMDKITPLLKYDNTTTEIFYSRPPLNDVPQYWITDHYKTQVRDKYDPHITLGLGAPEKMDFPIHFTASRFALCHLGIFCTCREILAEYELN